MSTSGEDRHLYDLSQPLQQQLRLTAKIALVVSLFALAALLITLYFLFRGQPDGYLQIIVSLTRSQEHLFTAMLIGGAIIIVAAGLILWFVMLYSSARIAGPLYRFSKNVEMEINEGPVQTIQLRKGDHLQELSSKLARAAEGLKKRHARQMEPLGEIESYLANPDQTTPHSPAEFRRLVENLRDSADRC